MASSFDPFADGDGGGAAADARTSSKVLLRGRGGVEILDGPPAHPRAALRALQESSGDAATLGMADVVTVTPDASFPFDASTSDAECDMSSDGRLLAMYASDGVLRVREMASSAVVMEVAHAGIKAVQFSPLGSSLITWQRPEKAEEGQPAPAGNLIVWSVANGGAIAARFSQRSYSRDKWPYVSWTSDEAMACRCVSNEVHLYDGANLGGGIVDRIRRPGVAHAVISSGPAPYKIALFVAEKKGVPAIVSLFQHPQLERPVCSQSFFRAQDVKLMWSPTGEAVLAYTSTDVDATGKSYYGETGLYLLRADGEACAVPQQKEGPMYDVAWGPTGKAFVVVAGTMPARATLFDARCKPVFDFGAQPRNTVAWSPHGRFLCLAGFGNLPGEMDFWDVNKLKKIGAAVADGATNHGWSPCSRYFGTMTLFPRLRVDNGFKLWAYDGRGPLLAVERPELYAVTWQGAAAGVFPDRPADELTKGEKAAQKAAGGAKAPAIKKVGAYRPPGSTGGMAAMMRREREADAGSRKLGGGGGGAGGGGGGAQGRGGLEGAEDADAGLSKSQKDKLRKKKAAERRKAEEDAKAAATAAAAPPPGAPGALTPEIITGKIAKCQKKLKQIDAAKAKLAKGEELQPDQAAKVATEDAVREELAKLQVM